MALDHIMSENKVSCKTGNRYVASGRQFSKRHVGPLAKAQYQLCLWLRMEGWTEGQTEGRTERGYNEANNIHIHTQVCGISPKSDKCLQDI